jgi:hypothetical protein
VRFTRDAGGVDSGMRREEIQTARHVGQEARCGRCGFRPGVPQSKLTISTQFEPLPVGYLPINFSAPLDGSIE